MVNDINKDILKKLDIIINNNEYFNHYISILMSKFYKNINTNIYQNLEYNLLEDIKSTFERKELSDYYRDNSKLTLAYHPMPNSNNLRNELVKIKKKIKRKLIIDNLIN